MASGFAAVCTCRLGRIRGSVVQPSSDQLPFTVSDLTTRRGEIAASGRPASGEARAVRNQDIFPENLIVRGEVADFYGTTNKLCGRPPQYAPAPAIVDLLTLKVVSESRVTWAICVPILVFLGLSVLDLGPMYATDRQTSDRQTPDAHHRLMPRTPGAGA